MLRHLKKKIVKVARRHDKIKKVVIVTVGILKYIAGNKDEARSYWGYAGYPVRNDETKTPSTAEYYDGEYYRTLEDENYRTYIESAKRLVISTFPEKTDEICDVGCGRGFLVKALHEEGYIRAIGIEVSRSAIEKKVTENAYNREMGSFKSNQFKVVSLLSVLEHLKVDDLQPFLRQVHQITSDYVVACIPVYPDNLFDFFRDTDHRIFERREWWNQEFEKAGLYPSALSSEALPFVEPFVLRKAKTPLASSKVASKDSFRAEIPRIHFAVDMSCSTSFTWVTTRLALALTDLGYDVSVKPSSMPASIELEDHLPLQRLMAASRRDDVHIKWSHYWEPYMKQQLNGAINFELFAINYFFKANNTRLFDFWINDVLSNGNYKLPISNFCQDVLVNAGVAKDTCPVLPLGYSPEIMTVSGKIGLPTRKRFKFLAITNAQDPKRYGTDILLQAYTETFSKEDDVVLVIKDYGGIDPQIERAIRLHQDDPEIVYIPKFFPKDILIKLYNSCDAFVAPFRGEGFGMKVIDAMACGLITILPLFGGPTEYATAANCFPVDYEVVPMGDCLDSRNIRIGNDPHWCEAKVDSLSGVMRYVYEHADIAKGVAARGREHVLEEFSWERTATRLINTIAEIIDKH